MLTVTLAEDLRAAGLRWSPRPGDRFVLPGRGMDDEVFVLSDMTVEVHQFPTGQVIGFNGVTEWALDSVEVGEALWLPLEHQLRDLLGGMFVRLEAVGADTAGSGDAAGSAAWAVTTRLPDGSTDTHTAAHPDLAYAGALLAVLRTVTAPAG